MSCKSCCSLQSKRTHTSMDICYDETSQPPSCKTLMQFVLGPRAATQHASITHTAFEIHALAVTGAVHCSAFSTTNNTRNRWRMAYSALGSKHSQGHRMP